MATDSTMCVYSTLGNDPDLQELVALFVEEMPGRIGQFLSWFESGDYNELQRAAHQMKGAAGSYGFHEVTPLAGRLETTLRAERFEDEIKANLNALIELCGRIRAGFPA